MPPPMTTTTVSKAFMPVLLSNAAVTARMAVISQSLPASPSCSVHQAKAVKDAPMTAATVNVMIQG